MQNVLEQIDWERYELIPTIVQNQEDKQVLMLAYSSKQSLALSVQNKIAHYFSRSKQRIWQKGEQSGHIQHIKEILLDCDNDSLIFIVQQVGVACHTGEKSCFFKGIAFDENYIVENPAPQNPHLQGVYHILSYDTIA